MSQNSLKGFIKEKFMKDSAKAFCSTNQHHCCIHLFFFLNNSSQHHCHESGIKNILKFEILIKLIKTV